MSSDIHALSGAYAVDALDDDERVEFERHLAGCESCRAEVDSLREAASALAGAVAAPPPAELRERILAAAATIRPEAPRPAAARPRSAVPRHWPTLLVAAVAVLVVGVGAVVWQSWRDDPAPPVASPVEQVVRADDVERHRLVLPDGAVIVVYRSPSLDRAVVQTEGMAPAPAGHVYQLWLQDDAGAMLPAGVMEGGADTSELVEDRAAAADGIGVTVEPEGGSPAPTTEPIALIAFDGA